MPARLLLLVATSLPAVAASDPGTPGPYATARQSASIPVTGGASRTADVYYPSADGGVTVNPEAGRLPAVVFGHGFSRNKDRYNDVGTHLASRGFRLVVFLEGAVGRRDAPSGLEPGQIDAVVKTGSSSSIQLFTGMLAHIFGKEKVKESNAFTSVVAGLAIRAKET